MTASLYQVAKPTTIQGISLGVVDLVTYDPGTQVLTPYLGGESLNPAPVSLPPAVLTGLVSAGCLLVTPPPPFTPSDLTT